VFAPSLLAFWFVNGIIDFSTALLIGSIASPAMLQVRLGAYVLLVPVFLGLRVGFYLLHPQHRQTVLSGACPQSRLLSLDWFSVGILATGLPLALQDIGPWLGMNLVFLIGVFVLPKFFRQPSRQRTTKLIGILLGILLFLFAQYGGLLAGWVPVIPRPGVVLGPFSTLSLSDRATSTLLRVVNSYTLGPVTIALFGYVMNRILTRPELTEMPYLNYALPQRDPWLVVVTSSMLGTAFYLLLVSLTIGQTIIVP
ncbi:MAG: hypothetical protein ABEH59_09845, partial [Halobacteriales archaeon]